MSQILLNQITPEQLEQQIVNGIKSHLIDLKNFFQPQQVPTEYLTRKEVAKLLKVDLSTIHNWTKSGNLISHMLVGRVYYKRNEIDEAMIKSIPTE
jgi:excisionase family DNA binding protein